MLTVERVFVADQVNLILNDPSVRPHIGGDGKSYSDATRFTINEECWVFLCSDHNGIGAAFFMVPKEKYLYEAHSQALPHFRGKQCITAARMCIDAIFRGTDCKEIFGHTPKKNKAANRFNKIIGMSKTGELPEIEKNIWTVGRSTWYLAD